MEWQLFEHWLSEILYFKFDILVPKTFSFGLCASNGGPVAKVVENWFWPAFALTFEGRFFSTGVKSTLSWGGWSTVPHRASQPYAVVLRVNGSHLIKNYLITFLALISGAWLSLARTARLPSEPFHPRDPPSFFPLAQTLVRYPALPSTSIFLPFSFAACKLQVLVPFFFLSWKVSRRKDKPQWTLDQRYS